MNVNYGALQVAVSDLAGHFPVPSLLLLVGRLPISEHRQTWRVDLLTRSVLCLGVWNSANFSRFMSVIVEPDLGAMSCNSREKLHVGLLHQKGPFLFLEPIQLIAELDI